MSEYWKWNVWESYICPNVEFEMSEGVIYVRMLSLKCLTVIYVQILNVKYPTVLYMSEYWVWNVRQTYICPNTEYEMSDLPIYVRILNVKCSTVLYMSEYWMWNVRPSYICPNIECEIPDSLIYVRILNVKCLSLIYFRIKVKGKGKFVPVYAMKT
jgi:hypothetical protein